MSEYPRDVVDENGDVFGLEAEPLGRGGQGVVFRSTTDPNVAVKFVAPAVPLTPRAAGTPADQRIFDLLTRLPGPQEAAEPDTRSRLRARLEDVRILPLPELHIARPLSMLRSHAGYTMQLLRSMVPMRHLVAQPGTPRVSEFYLEGGGLRRRLELLARSASILMRLHAMPVVYGDISPNNLFISAQRESNEVWFIDADNLAFESVAGKGVYTPSFGAPEVVQGQAGVTSLSDAWSFAVLAFYVLTQVHPFYGEYVEEGGWEDDEDREALALAGKLPWIHDPDDSINHTSRGIDRALVVSPALSRLFQQMFGPGRTDRTLRPSVAQLADALRQAADLTLSCPRCGWTFFVRTGRCPVCPAPRPGFFHLQVHRFDPDLDPDEPHALHNSAALLHAVFDGAISRSVVRRHLVVPTLAGEGDLPALELGVTRGRLVLTPLDEREYWIARRGSERPQRLDAAQSFPLPVESREVYVHCGPLDASHRLVAIRYWEAEP